MHEAFVSKAFAVDHASLQAHELGFRIFSVLRIEMFGGVEKFEIERGSGGKGGSPRPRKQLPLSQSGMFACLTEAGTKALYR